MAMSSPPEQPIAAKLDRHTLETLVDQYLDAVVAHDPSQLPLAKDVRFTEQGQELELGDGFWQTASGIGKYKHYFCDPEAGQVGFFGTVVENGTPALMGLRMRVELGRITEIETGFYRKGGGPGWNDQGIDRLNQQGKPLDIWLRDVPSAERLSRQELITTANYYFAGLQNNDGNGYYPFTDDCNRFENGYPTSNNPDVAAAGAAYNPMAMKVKDSMAAGYYSIVTSIYDRRFPVVDRERGAVLAFAVFGMNGAVHSVRLQNGQEVPLPMFSRPTSLFVFEAFKIDKGLIAQVEALVVTVPYGMRTGWPGGVLGS